MLRKGIEKLKHLINAGSKLYYIDMRVDEILAQNKELNEKLNRVIYNDPRLPKYLFYKVCEYYQEKTIQFIVKEMKQAVCITDFEEYLSFALDNVSIDGDIFEFGVYSGYSINYLSSQWPDIKFYGFDSFEGLPEKWDGYHTFDFDMDGEMPQVNENVNLIKGWFDKSLPGFLDTYNGKCALIHVDCDIYSSTKVIFDHIYPYLEEGTIILFDEFFNYPNYEEHEMKAFFEIVEERGMTFEYLAYCGERVMVRVTDV